MAHTQAEALQKKDAADAAKTVCTLWCSKINTFYSEMLDYKSACNSRRDAVESQLFAADLAYVNNLLSELSDCFGPALTNYGDALSLKGDGNAKLGSANSAYMMGQWDAAYNNADLALTKYSAANGKATDAKNGLEAGREDGIQANARINTYNNLTGDPGEPTPPTVPTGP